PAPQARWRGRAPRRRFPRRCDRRPQWFSAWLVLTGCSGWAFPDGRNFTRSRHQMQTRMNPKEMRQARARRRQHDARPMSDIAAEEAAQVAIQLMANVRIGVP